MAEQFRFSVKVMPPVSQARVRAPSSPQKPIAQFIIGANPRETWEDIWNKIQESFEKSYDIKITGQGWFHKLQTADGFDIVVSKDKVGNLGFGPSTPRDQLQLVMLTNPVDREGSLAYSTALRPPGFKRPRLSTEEEHRVKRQRHEEERYGARIEDIDQSFAVTSREPEHADDDTQWQKDDDGFTIPKLRAQRPRSASHSSPSSQSVRAPSSHPPQRRSVSHISAQHATQAAIESRTPASNEPTKPAATARRLFPDRMDFDEEIEGDDESLDDVEQGTLLTELPLPPESGNTLKTQTAIVLDSQPSFTNTSRGPPTPVSAEDSHRAPTSAQRPKASQPQATPRQNPPPNDDNWSVPSSSGHNDAASKAQSTRSAYEALQSDSTKGKGGWTRAESALLIEAFTLGMIAPQVVKKLKEDLGIDRSASSIRAKKRDFVNRGYIRADLPSSSAAVPSSSAAAPSSSPLPPNLGQGARALFASGAAGPSKQKKASKTALSKSSHKQTKLLFLQQDDIDDAHSLKYVSSPLQDVSTTEEQGKGKGRATDYPPPGFATYPKFKPSRSEPQQFARLLASDDTEAAGQTAVVPQQSQQQSAPISINSSPPLPDATELEAEAAVEAENEEPTEHFDDDVQPIELIDEDDQPAELIHADVQSVELFHEDAQPLNDNVASTYGSSIFNRARSRSPAPTANAEATASSNDEGEPAASIDDASVNNYSDAVSEQESVQQLSYHSDDESAIDDDLEPSPELSDESAGQWNTIYKKWNRECKLEVSDRPSDIAQAVATSEEEASDEVHAPEPVTDAQVVEEEFTNNELPTYKILEVYDKVHNPPAMSHHFSSDDEEIGEASQQEEALDAKDSAENDSDTLQEQTTPIKDSTTRQQSSLSLPTPPRSVWQRLTGLGRNRTTGENNTILGQPVSRLRTAAMNAHIPPAPGARRVKTKARLPLADMSDEEP